MSELISSTTVLCPAPEPQQFVLHCVLLLWILWRSLTEELGSDSRDDKWQDTNGSLNHWIFASLEEAKAAQDSLTARLGSL